MTPGEPEPPAAAARPYHHGDLRAALVAAAIDLLRTGGAEALTLRAVARAAGVSQAAPYRHFADRRALVAAVAEEGFRALGAAMMAAIATSPGTMGLKAVAEAYVRFGHEHPAEYRVMFGPEVARTDDLPSLRAEGRGVLEFVARGIGALQQAGVVGPGDPGLMAVTTWATLHGLVTLSLDGQTEGVAPALDVLVDEATRMMMFGMAARPSGPASSPASG
jgi:AcrR family transcriptional regulator